MLNVFIFIGVFGVLSNILIVLVLTKRGDNGSEKHFSFLVVILAVFDLLSCVVYNLSASSLFAAYGEFKHNK